MAWAVGKATPLGDARQEVDVNLPSESDFTTDVPEALESEVKREELNLGKSGA